MLKPGKTFNLSKEAKRMMASHADPHMSNHVKRLHIQAELAQAIQPKREKGAPRGTTPTGDLTAQ
jgi:hypothetical protein